MNASTSASPKSKPDSESESAMTPPEYLAAAEAALASDRPLEGSRLLWLAAEAAFVRLAKATKLTAATCTNWRAPWMPKRGATLTIWAVWALPPA